MCTRGRDEGKPYRNTFPCRGKIFKYEELSILTQFAKMKTVLYLTCGTGARDSGQYRSIMTTYLNALMHFQRENIKVRKK